MYSQVFMGKISQSEYYSDMRASFMLPVKGNEPLDVQLKFVPCDSYPTVNLHVCFLLFRVGSSLSYRLKDHLHEAQG